MAEARVEGEFALVYLLFNSLSNLTSQDAQVACFRNAAAHLEDGGSFVVEMAVPPVQKLPKTSGILAFDRSSGHWGIDEVDVATQQGISHHIWFDGPDTRRMSLPYRFVWPSELDLMAKIAGFELAERWEDWNRSAFTSTSEQHVSVWRKA